MIGNNRYSIKTVLMVVIVLIVELSMYVPVYSGDEAEDICRILFKVNSSWDGGYIAEISILNVSDELITDWELSFSCYDEIVNLWGGIIVDKTLVNEAKEESTISTDSTGDREYYLYDIAAEEYNGSIEPDNSITIGFVGQGGSMNIWGEKVSADRRQKQNEQEENSGDVVSERFPYMMFASSNDKNAISIDAKNLCFNGDIASNGTVGINGKSNGRIIGSISQNTVYLNNKITDIFMNDETETYEEDYQLNGENIRLEKPILGEKGVYISGNTCEIKTIISNGYIDISGDTINNDGSAIYSRYGDIVLDGKSVNLKGLVYAPFGNLYIKADSFNANGVVIIAKRINIECDSFNANYDPDIAEIVGIKSDNREMVPVTCFEYLEDTDGDRLPDLVEDDLGTDQYNKDSDRDGLSDYIEAIIVFTNPLEKDTDGDGVMDPDEDTDGDGLSNIDEVDQGTNLICVDTDGDNLTDYDEIVVYASNPLVVDTDGDGLDDYDDVKLGFSPLLNDTDSNGVLDPDEIVEQTICNDFPLKDGRGLVKAEVTLETSGNLEKSAAILNVYETDSLSRDVEGLFGVPIDVRCNAEFDKATICFTYDESALGEIQEDNLAVLWYDEANGWYHILDRECIVDTDNNTVSYTTNHFSTYMLVDRVSWYDAWRENIDYGISSNEDNEIHSFDIVFVVDTSGSMKGSRIVTVKKAVNSFIDAMEPDDEAALVSFTTYAYIKSRFTKNLADLKRTVNNLTTGGGTLVDIGLQKALELFQDHSCDNRKIVVLLCDGEVNYVQSTIDEYIKENIQIYAINLQNEESHTELQKMADQTNGRYYYVDTVDELSGILGIVKENTINGIDPTDVDDDGLYDIFETAGIKLPNGKIINTDPTVKDTDGDSLSDYDEVGIVYNVDDRYIGYGEEHNVKYFIMKSNPTIVDTDGDGISDKDDKHPIFAEHVSKMLINKLPNTEYLKVENPDYNGTSSTQLFFDGGYQGWWRRKMTTTPDPTSEDSKFLSYLLDPSYRLSGFGCGVIAMSDLEIFLTQQNGGFRSPNQGLLYESTISQNGLIKYDDYVKYVEYNRDNVYKLNADYISYYAGVLPSDMEKGIEEYLKYNNHNCNRAIWAPYSIISDPKIETAEKIEKMIGMNIPVVFAYHSFLGEKLVLYQNEADALNDSLASGSDGFCSSHYMTIIGIEKYLEESGISYKYILKVVSWGNIYYVNYDEYAKKLSSFSNILELK